MYHMQNPETDTNLHECLMMQGTGFNNSPDIQQCKFLCSGIYGNTNCTTSSQEPAVSVQFESLLIPPTNDVRLCEVDVSFV